MKSSKMPVLIYVAAVDVSMALSVGEGYLGSSSLLALLLTLPWSACMIVFAWALIHDGARSLLIFLIPFAGLNAFIIYQLANRRIKNGQRGGAAAA